MLPNTVPSFGIGVSLKLTMIDLDPGSALPTCQLDLRRVATSADTTWLIGREKAFMIILRYIYLFLWHSCTVKYKYSVSSQPHPLNLLKTITRDVGYKYLQGINKTNITIPMYPDQLRMNCK